MEIEVEGRVKPLAYKVKAMSRESPSQKASHVLDADLRSHWSTSTNTKEWILLELNEPCLLSHIRIHNKSVLEWEISVGLRFKPETFVKVRPRCEAPRRDVVYPMNYTPCRFVRISCLRGNPISIFFIQPIGVSVSGLEPEFQPVVNHLLPHITSHKQDAHDMHLQLLKDMTSRLHVFLPQLEAELSSFSDAAEPNLRFLAMLAGPFYPILYVVNERATRKSSGSVSDSEVSRNSQPSSALTVSSNFEPRKLRNTSPFVLSTSSSMVFRPDVIFMLLRKAYKDSDLGTVCRTASRILQKVLEPVIIQEASTPPSEMTSGDESLKSEILSPVPLLDYSNLFGEDFQLPDDQWDSSHLNILDLGAVEEGIIQVLFACASQPILCSKLAGRSSDFWSALPLVQALLPALRPLVSSPSDIVDDNFSQWKQPIVQQALSQIVVTSSSSLYRPLLHACAGYLSSFSQSHAKAASVLIDLCCSVLAPWMAQVIAKVDLAVELLEDLLGTIQGAKHSLARARAALKYIVLAISGHMDDILGKYKEVKHKILFLVEMLEPFIDPAIASFKSTIAFGDLSSTYPERQQKNCAIALNVIRTAVQKPAVLPSLESEWRRGSVAPSVLLAVLEPHMQLPPEIDLRTCSFSKPLELESGLSISSTPLHGVGSAKLNSQEEIDGKTDVPDSTIKTDIFEDVSLLFAPTELRSVALTNACTDINEYSPGMVSTDPKAEVGKFFPKNFHVDLGLDTGFAAECLNLQADYFRLVNYQDCELKASEFRCLAADLHSQDEITLEGHDAAIDALLLAAECYVNPFFTTAFMTSPDLTNCANIKEARAIKEHDFDFEKVSGKCRSELETIALLEKKRDRIVLQILLEAAELDQKYEEKVSDGEHSSWYVGLTDEQIIKLSPFDAQSMDAITLVRQNQALLCNFLVKRLQRERHSLQEILIQSLVFLLHSATKLYCSPEHVIDIVLHSAEYLNGMLTSLYHQLKEGGLHLEPERIHGIRRRWILLQRLVIASSSADEGMEFAINKNNTFTYTKLIPPSAWTNRISSFSGCKSPLVRFLGWMAVSRNARHYVKDRVFLASDLQQLMYLLSIFADELAVVDNVINRGHDVNFENSSGKHVFPSHKGHEVAGQQHESQSFHSFHVIYPDLFKFFPNMKKQFGDFGEIILEAVGLQLRSLPSTLVPDILCWFSELCSWPFHHMYRMASQNSFDYLKGHVAKNAKVVVLYVLEAIITEHMEAMVPETPRVMQVLLSLCRASYCDVSFLDSVLCLLNPIISYSLNKVSEEERLFHDDLCLNFESLCFDELFNYIRLSKNEGRATEEVYSRGLTIFILGAVFLDLSVQRRKEMMQSLLSWADFTAFEPTAYFYDYLSAFQNVMKSCKLLLVKNLQLFGAIPLHPSSAPHSDNSLESQSWFLSDVYQSSPDKVLDKLEDNSDAAANVNQKVYHLSTEEIEEFSKDVEILITKLNPTIELCWNLHHQLTKKLTITVAECFFYSRCLSSIAQKVNNVPDNDSETSSVSKPVDQFLLHWKVGLDGIAETILTLQEKGCWEVASVMLDCLLEVPLCFGLGNVIGFVCSALKNNSCSAPKIAWRLRTEKWLSTLLARYIHALNECDASLADLFSTLLGHLEPEQRFIALKLLGKLVGQDTDGRTNQQDFSVCSNLFSPGLVISISESLITHMVTSTWDLVVVMASSDVSLHLRSCAMALLVYYIPFAHRRQLQSFLAAADSFHGLGKLGQPICEGPVLRLSLALIAGACLYSSPGDISLIPQNVWRNIETLGFSKSERGIGDLEKRACQILCRLKNDEDEAKEALKEVLSATSSKPFDPDFVTTREAILQVITNLTSVQSYFDFFSDKEDPEAMELEEAEVELEILQKDHAPQQSLEGSKEGRQTPSLDSVKDDSRLKQIKESIRSLEKCKLREDIVGRRQRKLLMRHTRQKYLEEAATREAELLQELDRERTTEAEKEIERQRLLELERAKTSELRHNLDMEKERQTQRELQRELEQAESGLRPSRREFSSSTHSSRSRDRYRERENGRSGNDGSTRGSTGGLQLETSTSSSMMTVPTVMLSGSRPFSGQLPTILQSRDRPDECGSNYEENVDGSKDSGDTGSIGDPDLASAFDGQVSGFGSAQRHGSRGSKSRQVVERRERDGRREGKWERKHS